MPLNFCFPISRQGWDVTVQGRFCLCFIGWLSALLSCINQEFFFSGNILVLALQVQAGDKNRILQKTLTHFGGKSIA